MRHGKSGNKLGRNSKLRAATMRDLAKATLIHQRITTTLPKAKQAKMLIDRLITLGKENTLAAKRRAFAVICDHQLVSELFSKVAPRFKSRAGGYTRIIPLSFRRGDNARLAFLELTEKEVVVVKPTVSAKKLKKATETPDVVSAKGEVKHQDGESHKEQPPKKQDIVTSHPAKEKPKIKDDSGKRAIGGIQRMFRKTPTEK